MTNKLGLSKEEELKLKTLCEYLFFDQYKDIATYLRFERCFQPLLNDTKIAFDSLFKEICGQKKKYINYKRFIKSYLLYKKNQRGISNDLKLFFSKLMNAVLQKENSFVGKNVEKCFNFSTTKANKNRNCISMVQIFSDKNGGIHGLNLEYDDVFSNKMYPLPIEDNLLISLEMVLGIVDENSMNKDFRKKENIPEDKENIYRDSVTHVFGTFDKNSEILTFLGFKCVSGKTVFVGVPKGEGFLFGKFGTKFSQIKMQMTEDGIKKFEPIFNENKRPNYYLKNKVDSLNLKNLDEEEFILDEKVLSKLNNEDDIDKFITTPIVEDDLFFNKKLEDEIPGYDYKEVVNQVPRKWLLNQRKGKGLPPKILSVNDALQVFNEENERRNYSQKNNNNNNVMGANNNGSDGKVLRAGYNVNNNQTMKKLHKNKKIGKNNGTQNKKPTKEITSYKPSDIISSKENYNALKNELTKSIQDDIMEKEGSNFSNSKESLLEELLPEIKEARGERVNYYQPSIQQKKLKPTKIISKKKISNTKNDGKTIVSKVYYSDALQMFKDFSNGDDDDEENLFGFGNAEKYFPNDNVLRAGRYTYAPLTEDTKPRKVVNTVYISGSKDKEKDNKNVYDPAKSAEAQKKWKNFSEEIRKISGVYILQTIGSVIKAVKSIQSDKEGKNKLPISEKIKLMKLLEENEAVINFLIPPKKEEENKPQPQSNINENKEKEESIEEEDEDILLPDEHPENITSLVELEQKLNDVNKLLENKRLKEDDKKKLEKLKNLYLQQKNILIENETKKVQEEIIEKNNIDKDKIIQEEEEKRKKIEQEAQKEIEKKQKEEEEQKKKIDESKKKVVEVKKTRMPKKIYKNQEFYKGDEPFVDPLFKPEKNSLCPRNENGWQFPEGVTKDDVMGWDYYDWYRGEDILGDPNYNVFEEGISADDIRQGELGDCYFLSVIGSLCKFPKLLSRLFLTKEKTKEHVYGVYIFINGQWELVLIDDYFPGIGSKYSKVKRFAFGSSFGKELWVCLLEKAWSKINGCYAKVGIGGLPNEVFDVLTEAYSEQVSVGKGKKDELWEKLIDSEKRGYVMTAGTTSSSGVSRYGLSPAHAYSVLGVLEIDTGKGVEKVMKLRNPWGNGEYSGDWSDSSSKWTEELKQKYNFIKKNDGDFYMSYDDFITFFSTMGFAKLHQEYVTKVIRIEKEKATKCQMIKIIVPPSENGVHTYLQLYEKNPRIILNDGTYQKTALSFLILVDKDFNFIGSMCGNKMHICVENILQEGEYYLFSDVNYRYDSTNKSNHGYNITSYGEKGINFENVTDTMNVGVCLQKAMIDYCKKNVTKSKTSGIDIYVTKSYNNDLPFTVGYFENETDKNNIVTIETKGRGSKSFCYYCDEIATEEDEKVDKDLPAKDYCIILIMKYTSSSLFSFNYLIKSAPASHVPKKKEDPKPVVKPEPKPVVKPEPKPVVKPEPKPVVKPEPKPVVKPEPKPVVKPEPKPVVKPEPKPVVNPEKKDSDNLIPDNFNKKISDTNLVFKEKGKALNANGDVLQYVLEGNGGYIFGIENNSKKKIKVQVEIEGLELTDSIFKGRSSPSFYVDPKGKKVISSVLKENYNGKISFKFIVP